MNHPSRQLTAASDDSRRVVTDLLYQECAVPTTSHVVDVLVWLPHRVMRFQEHPIKKLLGCLILKPSRSGRGRAVPSARNN